MGADVIAGFPGETGQDHSTTLAFIETLPLTYLHVFSFSERLGTQAAALANEVPTGVIKRRARQLRALGEKKSAAFRNEQIGTQLRVLTLQSAHRPSNHVANEESCGETTSVNERSPGNESTYTPALSSNYLRVRMRGGWPANQWINARICAVGENVLIGEPEESINPELRVRAFA